MRKPKKVRASKVKLAGLGRTVNPRRITLRVTRRIAENTRM
ncbi:unnamed protein product [Spirodela intermedia]|uniref:Uncharacterized protein n=2 Tax=Spirodela intermedia TaxID=51605 RepID=A0A7I8JDA5_SPIIN|nr:unnamed protein product [Spirodela intermedia]CAA6668148.1 unnamed protein product [Spirodela intermedia]CAA7404981.1 unnamed protein product [Spirodela intermedia]